MRQTKAQLICRLVEQVLGQKLRLTTPIRHLADVDLTPSNDGLELIKHYLNNPHLITSELIASTVFNQLKLYPLKQPVYDTSYSSSWQEYVDKLERVLEDVKYRRANNYEFNELMPSMQELLHLQQECLMLTEKWYGHGNGNISCFYLYFVAMSEAAYVTCFEYYEIDKFASADRYVAQLNLQQRHDLFQKHEQEFYHDFVKQGGRWARGRSEIDATSIANIFYYKNAHLMFDFLYAQDLVVNELGLENYGQLEYSKRVQLWELLQEHFPPDSTVDEQNIFYIFTQYINLTPGEFFNYFTAELPEAAHVTPKQLFDAVKIAGIESGNLILLSRNVVDNWPPKRNLNLHWIRKYPLSDTAAAGHHEWPRIWPNEIPYLPGHGLSLCGNGLVEGWERFGSIAYEWNTPTDAFAEETNIARDIEKLFRELRALSPNIQLQPMLPGEQLLSAFQNAIAYSTIKITQHTHIMRGTLDSYLLYTETTGHITPFEFLQANLELVPVGNSPDAFFIKIYFDNLENEALIQFLVAMNQAYHENFGSDAVDAYIHLFTRSQGGYVFIYEPHAYLVALESHQFLNPENQKLSVRRPQLVTPQGCNIAAFEGELAKGRDFLIELCDATCKKGAYDFFSNYLNQSLKTPR